MVCAKQAKKSLEEGTQRIRLKLLAELEAIFDLAEESAKTAKTPKQRQLFMRVMAYIAQVMNSLSKAFDEAEVTRELEELEKMIDEAMAKGEDQGAETKASGEAGS